jgi:hypothetical protein
MAKPNIAVIASTTQATRFGEKSAEWICDFGAARADLSVEPIALRESPASPTSRRVNPRLPRLRQEPWISIVIAIIAVISIIGAELWVLRQIALADSSGSFTVASDLNRALASVAETSLLVGPME